VRAVWDRGLEFLSDLVTQSCLRLQVQPVALPAYSPHLKGRLERWWLFLKTNLLPTLPGYSHGPADLRGHSALTGYALGEDAFLVKLADWIDWYLTEHVHSDLGCTPLQAWQADGTPLDLVPDEQLWQDFLLAKNKVKVSKNGIRFDTIDYLSRGGELNGKVGRHVQIRYLPHDRSFIEVFLEGEHLCTAIPRENLTPDEEIANSEARQRERRTAQARFTTANRQRRDAHPGHHRLTTDKRGRKHTADPVDDLLAGGEDALRELLAFTDQDEDGPQQMRIL
jgi:putative transposase